MSHEIRGLIRRAFEKLIKKRPHLPVALSKSGKPKECRFISLPAEIRLAIYKQLAPDCFLPYVPYQDYIGLFLSCKQIYKEMEYEALKAAPRIIHQLNQLEQMGGAVLIRPLRPTTFSSLMNLDVSIANWCRYSPQATAKAFRMLLPALYLHLSSLTIGLHDLTDDGDRHNMLTTLSATDRFDFQLAIAMAQATEIYSEQMGGESRDYYKVYTNYSDIVEFVMQVSCLLAPRICDNPGSFHRWCLRKTPPAPPRNRPHNVRKVVLQLKHLHPEGSCSECGKLPHDVYWGDNLGTRTSPMYEQRELAKQGWSFKWLNENGELRTHSDDSPATFIWRQIKVAPEPNPGETLQNLLIQIEQMMRGFRRV